MKKVWITSLTRDEAAVGGLLGLAKRYGLDADGHFWKDDLAHMAWQGPLDTLLAADTSLWVIVGSAKDMAADAVRYGLFLLTVAVQSAKGAGFPIIWIDPEGKIAAVTLPQPLRGALVLNTVAAAGAKMAARANLPLAKTAMEYRLAVHANPGYGVWLEIGPGQGHQWNGVFCGVAGARIDAHGAGPAGSLPQKAVLEYPIKDMKIALGEVQYSAWAIQNALDQGLSYYVRVQGIAQSIVFGPHVQTDEAEAYVLNL